MAASSRVTKEPAMPRLMEKTDWLRTVANVGSADRVWFENIMGREGSLSFSIPESGMYQVILVKLDSPTKVEVAKRKSAHDLIGYCKRFNPEYRSTADIKRELPEGEDE